VPITNVRNLKSPCWRKDWSMTTLKERLIKIGAKVVSHGRYVAFQMAEVAISRHLFRDILRLIARHRDAVHGKDLDANTFCRLPLVLRVDAVEREIECPAQSFVSGPRYKGQPTFALLDFDDKGMPADVRAKCESAGGPFTRTS
jgi:hypothetical protein